MKSHKPIRVLFVCTGNICRSPMAEAVFLHLVKEAGLAEYFDVASAGTSGHWHEGEPPHHGTQNVLRKNQVAIPAHSRAMPLSRKDMEYYDYILAMDSGHMREMNMLTVAARGEVRLFLEFAPSFRTMDVPDPYYTGRFDEVYAMVYAGSCGLLEHIRQREQL